MNLNPIINTDHIGPKRDVLYLNIKPKSKYNSTVIRYKSFHVQGIVGLMSSSLRNTANATILRLALLDKLAVLPGASIVSVHLCRLYSSCSWPAWSCTARSGGNISTNGKTFHPNLVAGLAYLRSLHATGFYARSCKR
jgi:hypothetical protein